MDPLCRADVILSSWPDETDSSGVKVRNISYTLTLTNPLGPKTSPSTERQVRAVSSCVCLNLCILMLSSFDYDNDDDDDDDHDDLLWQLEMLDHQSGPNLRCL